MNRLRDDSGSDPVSERGLDILRRTQATPNMPDLRRRVWASLQQQAAPRVSAGLLRHGLKGLVLGISVLTVAATAGAAIGGRWISSVTAPAETPAFAPRPRAPHVRVAAPRKLAVAPEALLNEPAAEPVATAPADTGLRATHRPIARRTAPPAVVTPPPRTEVLDALIALRRDHDPARAAGLLDQYLAGSRRGALREEALALAIEAADAGHDPAGARRFARTYELEYPGGRFGQFARNHLTAEAPQ
jgi:hypothetical protein